jgi:hypothetical protein
MNVILPGIASGIFMARVALWLSRTLSLANARAKAYGARRAVGYKNVQSLAFASAKSYGARRVIAYKNV